MFEKAESTDQEYIPCYVKLKDLDGNFNSRILSPDERRQLASKIIEMSLNLAKKHEALGPRPLIFVIDSPDLSDVHVVLEQPVETYAANQAPRQYEPHFWIPESCLLGLSEQEKALRRELFAVGCLVYSVLRREKPWDSLPGSSVQDRYERGIYPRDVLDTSHWLQILLLWSEEFAKWIKDKNSKAGTFGTIKKVAVGTAIAGTLVGGAALMAPAAIGLLGFGSAGVGAGTFAAGWQASIGLVPAGSLFAFLQSAGAGGAALGVISQIAVGGIGTGAGAAAVSYLAGAAEECNGKGENGRACEDKVKDELFESFLAVVRKTSTA
ncbi:hypothetical protein ABW21_db0209469 [Orbilia brochopaga]|nr:hypothetical protein ABW21_db0209469 [Drechslerella brochopaga]